MAVVIITEFRGIAGQTLQTMQAAPQELRSTAYTVTAGSVTSSFSFSSQTNLIRVCCMTNNIAYTYGPLITASSQGPVATTTSTPLVSTSWEYRGASPGDYFAAITI